MTVSLLKTAVAMIHDPEIDSVWEYKGQNNQTLWACYTKGKYLDIYGSCTALKHDGEITPMGKDFLNKYKPEIESDEYPISPETRDWWEEKMKELHS